jgi:hypothetical protein
VPSEGVRGSFVLTLFFWVEARVTGWASVIISRSVSNGWNKHMMCDFGTGNNNNNNNNKLNWVLEDKQELIDILDTIHRGAKRGRDWMSALKISLHTIGTRITFKFISPEELLCS